MTRNLLLRCSTLLLLLAVGGSGTLAETVRADDESASRSVERRLRQEPFPWFSAKNQEFVFLPPPSEENDEPPKTPPKREFDWLFRIFWGIAAVVVGILSLLVVWSIVRLRLDNIARKNASRNDDNQQRRRFEALSPEAQDRIDDLLQAANDSRQDGDFKKAIIYYFSYLLVRLDENGSIRMRRGKTNLDYANEVAAFEELASFYNAASELFDRTYYGNYPIAADDFDSVWNDRDDFLNAWLNASSTKNVSPFPTTLAAPSIPIPLASTANPEIVEADSNDVASSKSENGFRRFWGVLIAVAFWTGTFGCHQEKVWKNEYRDVVPPSRFEKSVNGDSLFQAICSGEGNDVKTKGRLPRRLENVDVVVWHLSPEYYDFVRKINFDDLIDEKADGSIGSVDETNDDFDLLFKIQRFYKQWLEAKPGRSLVLVLPSEFADFDFWQTIEKIASEDQKNWVRSQIDLERSRIQTNLPSGVPLFRRPRSDDRRDEKEIEATSDRSNQTTSDGEKVVVEDSGTQNRWFDVELFKEPRTTVGLTGDPYWTQGISPEWRHFCFFRVRPLEESDVLLRSEDVPIVCSRRIGESRIFIVSTEKPFLNYYLIDVENRKLAGRLVDCWGRDKNILIVKNAGGFPRSVSQPSNESAFKLTETSPYSALVWRLIWVATLICFALFPILGRPKRIPETKLADFSRHIDAYGAALRRTNDVDWAKKQIERFRRRRE